MTLITWQRMLRLGMMVVLALMLCQCANLGRGAKVPPPTLQHGWSEAMEMEVNGENKEVRCMTNDDIRKINLYMELMKATTRDGE